MSDPPPGGWGFDPLAEWDRVETHQRTSHQREYFLREPPVVSTIEVWIQSSATGAERPAPFEYDARRNAVVLIAELAEIGDLVFVNYRVAASGA